MEKEVTSLCVVHVCKQKECGYYMACAEDAIAQKLNSAFILERSKWQSSLTSGESPAVKKQESSNCGEENRHSLG